MRAVVGAPARSGARSSSPSCGVHRPDPRRGRSATSRASASQVQAAEGDPRAGLGRATDPESSTRCRCASWRPTDTVRWADEHPGLAADVHRGRGTVARDVLARARFAHGRVGGPLGNAYPAAIADLELDLRAFGVPRRLRGLGEQILRENPHVDASCCRYRPATSTQIGFARTPDSATSATST